MSQWRRIDCCVSCARASKDIYKWKGLDVAIKSEFEEFRDDYLSGSNTLDIYTEGEATYISVRLYQALFESNDVIQREEFLAEIKTDFESNDVIQREEFLAEIKTDIQALELLCDDKLRADILAAALLKLPSFLKMPSNKLSNIKGNAKKAASIRHEKNRETKQKAKGIWLEWQEDKEMFKNKSEFARYVLSTFKDEQGNPILRDDKNIKDVWIKEWEAEKQHLSA